MESFFLFLAGKSNPCITVMVMLSLRKYGMCLNLIMQAVTSVLWFLALVYTIFDLKTLLLFAVVVKR